MPSHAFELVNLIGILNGTIRTVTWMLYHIYSDPAVLDDCRREIPHAMIEGQIPVGTKLRTMEITRLGPVCPILGSGHFPGSSAPSCDWHLRAASHARHTPRRHLSPYKGDGMVVMASVIIHSDCSIWGSDVAAFDHERFLRSTVTANGHSEGKIPSFVYFRVFGGGTRHCPG